MKLLLISKMPRWNDNKILLYRAELNYQE